MLYGGNELVNEIYEEIKKAFLKRFDNCRVLNRSSEFKVEFNFEEDAEWFENNVCNYKGLNLEDYPINFLSTLYPVNNEDIPTPYAYKSFQCYK